MAEEFRGSNGSERTITHMLFNNFRDRGFVADVDALPPSVETDLHGEVETIQVRPSQMVIDGMQVVLPVRPRDMDALMRDVTEDWLV